MKKLFLVTLLIISTIMSGYCGASKYMKKVEGGAEIAASADKATIVFMRPSSMAFAIQAPVIDISGTENVLVGIVSSKTKVAYRVDAGEHLFAVGGESADMMKASVEAGKIYYVVVGPRMGVWKARFVLDPIRKNEVKENAKLAEWLKDCTPMEMADSAQEWLKDNSKSLNKKREKCLKAWEKAGEKERFDGTLAAEDGK